MSAEFYLFDVDHGQAAALKLPNGRWCVFDLGASQSFSPLAWIEAHDQRRRATSPTIADVLGPPFRLYYATATHLHADHLTEAEWISKHPPEFVRTVDFDNAYLQDALDSGSQQGQQIVVHFATWYRQKVKPGPNSPNFAGVSLRELGLSVEAARQLGGSPNSKVNNASIVTRLEYAGRSILLCGDVEEAAWDAVLSTQEWRSLVSSVDILVAPHHGHKSGLSRTLMELARPTLVLVSVAAYDPNVDPGYSDQEIAGLWDGSTFNRRLTTRDAGHILVQIEPSATSAGQVTVATAKGPRGQLGPSHSESMQAVVKALMAMSSQGNMR
jgi:Metallo-beta-lactamase superfamily